MEATSPASATAASIHPSSSFVNNMMAALFASALFYGILGMVIFVIVLARYLEQKCCTTGDEESIRVKFKPEKASLGSGSSSKSGVIRLGAMRIKWGSHAQHQPQFKFTLLVESFSVDCFGLKLINWVFWILRYEIFLMLFWIQALLLQTWKVRIRLEAMKSQWKLVSPKLTCWKKHFFYCSIRSKTFWTATLNWSLMSILSDLSFSHSNLSSSFYR